ncbi:uncharacterized protein LOC119642173 isoform X1 [Glossina fuscipes]|uniref:Uncharacterized protein LOC119642173 isoform X1 n=2 Tax=Glossina fuscipes TaxID=7396 RepID=A0A9C6DYI3_9MUSC|nr:uncharacterized protein LOC119642173 isoform X1 [Glossina fuscipes]
MPEPTLYSYGLEPPKKPPIIKLSCGIGDTDGFPAFDVDSDAYTIKDDSKWGFLITGGAEFHMPLTVFQVTTGGLADQGGIRLGDIILEINEEDATQLTLAQAHEKIDAVGKKIHFLVKTMEEDQEYGFEQGEEKSIVLRVPKPLPPPKVASIEARLKEMQRKLSEIAEIPKILSSTLATVSQTFDKLTNATQQQKRKFSYDEDAYDYELSYNDDNNDDNVEKYDANKAYLELKQRISQHHLRQSKDSTPESDYASENGDGLTYSIIRDNNSSAEEEDNFHLCENYVKNEKEEFNTNSNANVEHREYHRHHDDGDESDEDDFLTTTFTWHMRNLRKSELTEKELERRTSPVFTSMTATTTTIGDSDANKTSNYDNAFGVTGKDGQQKHKLDKLERCWPWADRERIIYKQSTCHLVPRRPLGLIEKRIQLLAKNNLLEHLTKAPSP